MTATESRSVIISSTNFRIARFARARFAGARWSVSAKRTTVRAGAARFAGSTRPPGCPSGPPGARTTEKKLIGCGRPSSKTSKSSRLRPSTGCPLPSVTTARTCTSSVSRRMTSSDSS